MVISRIPISNLSDHLQAINGRAGGWIVVRILISNPYQTTHILSMGEQQDERQSVEFLFEIHIRPLTSYQWKTSKMNGN